jgi:hypothetical protein
LSGLPNILANNPGSWNIGCVILLVAQLSKEASKLLNRRGCKCGCAIRYRCSPLHKSHSAMSQRTVSLRIQAGRHFVDCRLNYPPEEMRFVRQSQWGLDYVKFPDVRILGAVYVDGQARIASRSQAGTS